MSVVLRLPPYLEEQAAAQAAAAGLTLDQYVATAVAIQIGALGEAQRVLAVRAARSTRADALAVLERAGRGNPPRDDDLIEADPPAA